MKKRIFAFILLLVTFFAYSQNVKLEDFINEKYVDSLLKNGRIEVIHEKEDTNLSLIPNCIYKDKIITESINKNEKQVPFVAEFLYLVDKKDLLKNSRDKEKNITMDEISVVFRSISKMKGMLYHFEKPGKEEVLYKKAYMIENIESDLPINDQNTGNPDGQVSYCLQDDNTYGIMKYKLNYYLNENVLFSTFLLETPMSTMGIKAVESHNMKINIIAIDLGDKLLLYLHNDVAAKSIPLVNVRKQIKESMTVRMEAVYRWFLLQF